MSNFETTIQTYLENRAKTDSLFAETYKKANKSIKECCKYIYSQARKLAKGSNSVGIMMQPCMAGQCITTMRTISKWIKCRNVWKLCLQFQSRQRSNNRSRWLSHNRSAREGKIIVCNFHYLVRYETEK